MTPFEVTNQAVNEVEINNKAHHNSIFLFSIEWVKKQFRSFTSDDLKNAYFKNGNPVPTEPRVFGSVFRELSRDKMIFNTGAVRKSKNKNCHQRPQTVWVSKEYSLKQQQNRKTENQTIQLF